MHIHDLAPSPGSNRAKRRVGRGIAGKGGKTAGRGTKGQGARDTIPMGFEGGQLPLAQRVPKLKGFKNPFRVEYQVLNLDDVNELEGNEFTLESLKAVGIIHDKGFLKILGRGQITRAVTISAHAFSASARSAIEAAGGTATLLDPPYGGRRSPVQGNALANR
jgi:large subunit ribosomal protein L15